MNQEQLSEIRALVQVFRSDFCKAEDAFQFIRRAPELVGLLLDEFGTVLARKADLLEERRELHAQIAKIADELTDDVVTAKVAKRLAAFCTTESDDEPLYQYPGRDELYAMNENAIEIGIRYGQIDGDHHKLWTIDQMLRALLGSRYESEIRESCAGEEGPDTYRWDTGIAP